MGYDEFIAIINASAILVLLLLALLLLMSTRFRGENGYAAAIIVLTTIPTYFYNVCRSEEWYTIALWFAPLSFSVNTMLMPLLWLFVYRNFNAQFKFRPVRLLHFLPAAACLAVYCIYILSLPSGQRFDFMIHENTGDDTWLGDVNTAVVFTQMFTYFSVIFVYLHRVKKLIGENLSEAEWLYKLWIPKFMMLFAGLFLVVFVCYILWPRTDAWLFQILNVIAMGCLVFHSLEAAKVPQTQTLSVKQADVQQPANDGCNGTVDTEQLQRYADTVIEYLKTSEAYLNPDLTLQDVAKKSGTPLNKLSKAINIILHKNFFELVNKMRIEKSKEILLDYKENNLTIDMVASKCGFNTRITFYSAFKKSEGIAPSQWLKSNRNQNF